jgi:hypothetical protein
LSTQPTPPTGTANSLTLPLTAEQRAAYQNLYDKYETAIENTTDVGVLEALNASQLDVENVLTKDAMYQLEANTALYDALLSQINSTNKGLKTLQAQIHAIAAGASMFGSILAAISKVLALIPGA